jgi:hypothetical protein
MREMKKALLAVIAALIVSLVASACFVKADPIPSVPEFTVKLVEHPYDVPPSYSIDPYTGENVTNQGYHVYNRTIEVSIKNQPFTPYTDVNGHSISLYYNVSMKGHYGNTWNYYLHNRYQDYLPASGSSYTVVSFTLGASFREGYFVLGGFPSDIPAGGEVDFRVEALAGFYSYYRENWWFMDVYQVNFNGVESGWSNTQTITIPETSTSTSPSPNPTPTPTVPEFPTWIFLLIFTAMVSTSLLAYLKKHSH